MCFGAPGSPGAPKGRGAAGAAGLRSLVDAELDDAEVRVGLDRPHDVFEAGVEHRLGGELELRLAAPAGEVDGAQQAEGLPAQEVGDRVGADVDVSPRLAEDAYVDVVDRDVAGAQDRGVVGGGVAVLDLTTGGVPDQDVGVVG